MFNKYLSVCKKTANFILCSTLCSAISKNEIQTGKILDEQVVIHTHGVHLLSRHIPCKLHVPLELKPFTADIDQFLSLYPCAKLL